MSSKTRASSKSGSSSKRKKKSNQYRRFSGLEKVQAILSVWTESRKSSHVCRELKITWQQLNSWQDKAMAAMIESLEPPAPADAARPPALSNRLRKLLAKRTRKTSAKAPSSPQSPAEQEPSTPAEALSNTDSKISSNLSKRLSNLTSESN